jgi:transcription antitermination protein NusB
MLNRRNLRIKVMQSLFSLHQSKEANYELCIEGFSELFAPDLNSMEVQDKTLLSFQKKQSIKLFEKAFQSGETSIDNEDIKVKKAVNAALQEYVKQAKKDTDFFFKNLVAEVEKIYEHYLSVLSLGAAFGVAAESDKKVNHKNLIENAWIKGLRESEALTKDALKTNSHWQNKSDQDQVRLWFRDVVRQDAEYQNYLDKKDPSLEDQKKFVSHLFKKIILGKTIINDYYEEAILRWAEDKEIVKGLVEKTIKSYDPTTKTQLTLHTLTLNWEEDKEFIEKLYKGACNLEPKYHELIANNTRNWEVDRLPLTDRIILEMAIAELLSFPNIPVKVTINEYIELAKNYSTPKSRQFINGILDVIAKELKDSGEVKKSGRGLIDNR